MNVYFTMSNSNDTTGSTPKVPKVGGPSVTLAGGGYAIAVDESYVYLLDGVSVMNVSNAGGSPVVLAPGQTQANAIAVDDSYVYWTSSAGGGSLMKTSKN
jgi:hypothetical protein